MNNHALLSASSSHRWLTCPPLPRLESYFENKTSEAAHEGTLAHAVAENKLRKSLGMSHKTIQVTDKELDEYTDDYVTYILEQLDIIKQSTKDPIVLIEQRLDFSDYVPEGFGTGDCVIVSDKKIHIIDFKYGRGVDVSAVDNPQMKLYALGALKLYDALYDMEEVVMTIFQPRKYNVSTDTMSTKKLMEWAETELKEKAELAFEGKGVIEYGPWCQFSNCGVVLRARYDHHKKLDRFELKSPHLLTDAEVEEVLHHVDDLAKWATEVKAYATEVAIKSGKAWDGFKLVAGRTVRKFTDEEKVAQIAKANGYDNIYKQSLLSMTDLQKLMGKTTFEELFKTLIVKPAGTPVLVPESDKRRAINLTQAKDEFTEEK
ncbi:DUF2800 domain-containing protein [Carnobacteriaceae bacterium zg-84]|uniref:DUF2800 domain-containing protein n=1 Tax=Granulicatella sp. zg-84 TaxID=2678503 RepID=UPI0013BFF309|nr:DUF2800 domain-containing protein [Granulicatella sp. zg-84]NEW66069.1 DUF2800 domain-containing protein [Granulicatella sp. zg-84]QMI86599.1 DUF2800 domain-containing protein [Carnobacteriaceae bacterium zg-84]